MPPKELNGAYACDRRHKTQKRAKGEGNEGKNIVKRKIQRGRQGRFETIGSRNRN